MGFFTPRERLIDTPPDNPDDLDMHVGGAGTWGLPSDEGLAGQLHGQSPTMLRTPRAPTGDDYADGIFVGGSNDEDATASWHPGHLVPAVTDAPARLFQLPHEATHRRYEPLLRVPIAQLAAGYTLIAAPNLGLHFVKLIALVLTLDAAGTIKFVQAGDSTGLGISATAAPSDLTGLMNFGGAATPPLILPPSEIANPWLYTSPDLALGIFTVTGKAQGWAQFCYSPYDS